MRNKIPPKFDRSNFPWKVRDLKAGHVVKARNFCNECGVRRVKHHHAKCDICWNKHNVYSKSKGNVTGEPLQGL